MSSLSDDMDDVSVCSPPLFTPPPVAPLPPLPPFSRSAVNSNSNGLQTEVAFSSFNNDPESDGQRAYRYACSAIPDSLESYVCVSYQRKVEPIIQSGPQCGLVAAAMADSILHKDVTVEQLSEASQSQGFSKQGEIFSSLYLEKITSQAYGCKTSVLDIRDVGGKWEFLNCLARGDVLLVPYDPDKNFVPVLKKGHKAHWALVTGFFAAINDETVLKKFQEESIKKDSEFSNLYHCNSAPVPATTHRVLPAEPNVTPRALSANVPTRPQGAISNRAISARTLPAEPGHPPAVESTKLTHDVGNLSHDKVSKAGTCRNPLEAASYILVYAKQGKSKHTGIWNAKTLVESCCNLIEIAPDRLEDGESYTFPEKGIEEELCGKVVVIHVKK
ncbi:UPF0692 protein C19orf54 homolog [Mercenaria mercenaria]|uniref:UPF0692 protein C19orf54 homolog n=1 Tax=Mercenaria mercenaria TaxID=6596 RepID=UPI00234E6462|nr:UPF0692 protein C19orf54 homolog [Mercenaria mercenaria]